MFLNLAAVAGPIEGKPEAMMHINYHAPAAAAKACEYLGFGHWIQSSTQATNSERAGQVSKFIFPCSLKLISFTIGAVQSR